MGENGKWNGFVGTVLSNLAFSRITGLQDHRFSDNIPERFRSIRTRKKSLFFNFGVIGHGKGRFELDRLDGWSVLCVSCNGRTFVSTQILHVDESINAFMTLSRIGQQYSVWKRQQNDPSAPVVT